MENGKKKTEIQENTTGFLGKPNFKFFPQQDYSTMSTNRLQTFLLQVREPQATPNNQLTVWTVRDEPELDAVDGDYGFFYGGLGLVFTPNSLSSLLVGP